MTQQRLSTPLYSWCWHVIQKYRFVYKLRYSSRQESDIEWISFSQDKVYEELCGIYGDEDYDQLNITHEDLQRMEYMERVIKETMRLFPIAPILVRAITDDLNIGIQIFMYSILSSAKVKLIRNWISIPGEYTLPKGSSAVLGIIKTHRSEEYWHEPLKFDPERFLPEEIAKRHPYCYLPFSAGPRNCLGIIARYILAWRVNSLRARVDQLFIFISGIKYAMMAMKTLLATVLRRYVLKKDNIVPIGDIRLKAELMLKPVDPIKIRIEKRTPKLNQIWIFIIFFLDWQFFTRWQIKTQLMQRWSGEYQ